MVSLYLQNFLKQYLSGTLLFQIVAKGTRLPDHQMPGEPDPFRLPRERNMLRLIDSGSNMSTDEIITRIINHRYAYLAVFYIFVYL